MLNSHHIFSVDTDVFTFVIDIYQKVNYNISIHKNAEVKK